MAGRVPAIVRPQACHIREVKVPFRDTCFRSVADRNCVIVRWCGEQREANGPSVVAQTRFGRADWRASDGKVKPRPVMNGKPPTLTGQVTKRSGERWGDWRRRARKVRPVKWRDLRGVEQGMCARSSRPHAHPRAGVRALIVAMKPGNAGGAKGCRKVET